ncbi:TrbL/VirB6 family protein [Rhodovulum sulfidophilum]|uniref:type IV secretion system protein n=1 Tax=Rhodovulum sulfidophilum TaxID=35806 RepID=UPI001F2D5A5C|nr:type IV secretion system protein [Rhodovulum sulfidophilum]MCE8441459.1 type IV secretion system protein [Rhodovulum sulfidophilum]MCE8467933.1 type IV secretion system protein [Rhodovulum sulfidophilum]
MGIVTFIVEAADKGLDTVATSQFAAVAEISGTIIMGAATLAIIALFINMAWQIRPMDGREMLVLLFKISLIKAFALNWANFNFVSQHVIDGLDELAGSLIGSATGEDAIGSAYFAARFDLQMDRLAEYGNEAASHMSRVSKALMGVFFMALIALVGGLAGAVLVLAKMMITLLIGLAPVLILCSMFDVTKDYFHRWVSSLASFALYPVVIAGVFSMVFGLVTLLVSDLGSVDTADKAGKMVPFLGVVILSLVMVVAIPIIVPMISGNLHAGWAASVTAGSVQKMMSQSWHPTAPREFSKSTSALDRRANGGEASSATKSPPPSPSTGAKMQRTLERTERLKVNIK